MNQTESVALSIFVLFNLLVFLKSFYETKTHRNAYGLTRPLFFVGIFVWGDGVVFAPFWVLASLLSLFAGSWYLFLLIVSLFWVVRSLGEIIYWIAQQFSTSERNPIKNLPGHTIFHNDSIWFIHQIFWQCVMVFALGATIYIVRAML